jgi:hypothetical protein
LAKVTAIYAARAHIHGSIAAGGSAMRPATIVTQTGFALAIALAVCACAATAPWGPVSQRQRAEAVQDVPQDHPHPPARLAGVPRDGSTDKLYCYTDGPDTICHRQAP